MEEQRLEISFIHDVLRIQTRAYSKGKLKLK